MQLKRFVNACLLGESGLDVVAAPGCERGWRREAEHCFTMWCSGRQCCEGMLLTLKLIKVLWPQEFNVKAVNGSAFDV